MIIRFAEIPPQGLALEIADQSWFPDHELERHGVARAAVTLSRERERVIFAGWLEATVSLLCDRCLESYRHQVDVRFSLQLELSGRGEEATAQGEIEHACSREEMDTIFLDEDLVDVADLLAQQVFLSLPAKNLCSRDCRGLCSVCGSDLNHRDCGCAVEAKNSPFAVLKVLKTS